MFRVWLSLIFLLFQIGVGAQFYFEDVTSSKGFEVALSGDTHGSGVAAADYDQDGDIDLYICTARNYPDQLYRNENGTFTAVGDQVGLNSTARSRMALWIDIDGDHDLDLLVGGDCDFDESDCPESAHMRLYENENGMFTDISEAAGLNPFGPKEMDQVLGGLAAADINNDGYIDFVVMVRNGNLQAMINQQNNTFVEMADALGFDDEEVKYYQPFFHDFNADGYIDLYCNVDFGENQFYVNSSDIIFDDLARLTASNNAFNEMGISLGDYDNDGDFDMYATNIANYLGQDVYNIMLRRDPGTSSDIFFTEVAKNLEMDQGGWGWGVTFFDANNDGLLDLATTNGWDLPFEVIDQSKIWIQQSGRVFTDYSDSLGFNDELNAAALISLDYDRDGDLDMIQTIKGFETEQVPFRLLENKISAASNGNYLVVKPRMSGNNHFSIGASVYAYVDDLIHSRIIHAGTSFYGQEPAEAFFGLGDVETVDSLRIVWPGGETSWLYDIGTNQQLMIADDDVVHRPSTLTGEQLGNGIQLTWNDMSDSETQYVLQRSTSDLFTEITEIVLPENTTQYLDSDLTESDTYYYRLKGENTTYSSRFTAQIDISFTVLSVNDGLDKIRVYPNPASSTIHIETKEPIHSVQVFAINGAELFPDIKIESHNVCTITTDGTMRSGVYLLKVNGKARRIIISRD